MKKQKHTAGASRKIKFRVTTMNPIPVGEQVFVAGGAAALGDWNPAGFALTRTADLLWEGEIAIPADTPLEYKLTRGSWDAEEATATGEYPPNRSIPAGGDVVEECHVHRWLDQRFPQPHIVGDYRVHAHVASPHLRHARRIIVWLPPSYSSDPERRYPVCYMHDGQQVFDPTTSTWNQDWEVDEWCTKLIQENRLHEIIVVGIYSTPDRYDEYNPETELGQAYVRFVIDELKPMIDREYRTIPDRGHTAVAGSSMGGGIAFYMAWARPDIFFGAACLSPAFTHKQEGLTLRLVQDSRSAPDLRLYLYCGHNDELEQRLLSDLHAMRDALASAGMQPGEHLLIHEDPAGKHDEATWAKHTDHWLLFLFGK